jgi:S-adenosylmethionine hydrolase
VGGPRRAVAVEVGNGASVLVGPDNGLLAPAVALVGGADRAVELTEVAFQLEAPGPTFAGRDIFAPAAAHLCAGVPLADLGPEIDPIGLFPGVLPISHLDDEGLLVAEVLWVDRYGNAQLNVDPEEVADFGDRMGLRIGEERRTARRVGSYSEIGAGEIGLVVDSYGLLSVAVDRHSAAERLGLHVGAAVLIEGFDDEQEGPGAGVVTPVQLSPGPGGPR